MNKLLRTIWILVRARWGPRLTVSAVGRLSSRVRLTDIDILGHMNNGVYLSVADLGRMDLLVRSGIWRIYRQRGWYSVVAGATISFRKSLDLGQRYVLESRISGIDERSVYLEQRFTVDGEIFARMFVRGRVLQRTGGVVSMHEVAEALQVDPADYPVPDWLERWSQDVALPSTRRHAPSEWG